MCSKYLILNIILILILIVYAHSANVNSTTPHISRLTVFKDFVLNRRMRSLVFPKKAFLLLTPVFTKAVLGGRPTGLVYSIEFDMYSQLPDTVESWKPTLLLNKIKKEKEHELIKVEHIEPIVEPQKLAHHEEEPVMIMPLDMMPLDTMPIEPIEPAVPFMAETPLKSKVKAIRKFDALHYLPKNAFSFHDYQYPYAHTYNNNKKYDSTWYPQYVRNKKYWRRGRILRNSTNPVENSQKFQSVPFTNANKILFDAAPSNKQLYTSNQSYRERREIFAQLEIVGKIFNINMRACIQRAMCEVTTVLKPYGESLMEDIVRIVFSLPQINSSVDDDEYPTAKRNDYKQQMDCVKTFSVSCPYPVIEYLLKNIK